MAFSKLHLWITPKTKHVWFHGNLIVVLWCHMSYVIFFEQILCYWAPVSNYNVYLSFFLVTNLYLYTCNCEFHPTFDPLSQKISYSFQHLRETLNLRLLNVLTWLYCTVSHYILYHFRFYTFLCICLTAVGILTHIGRIRVCCQNSQEKARSWPWHPPLQCSDTQ